MLWRSEHGKGFWRTVENCRVQINNVQSERLHENQPADLNPNIVSFQNRHQPSMVIGSLNATSFWTGLKRFNNPQLRVARREALSLEGVFLPCVNAYDLEVQKRFSALNDLPVRILAGTFLIDCGVRGPFPSNWRWISVNAGLFTSMHWGEGSIKTARGGCNHNLCTVTEMPVTDEVRAARQTVISPIAATRSSVVHSDCRTSSRIKRPVSRKRFYHIRTRQASPPPLVSF